MNWQIGTPTDAGLYLCRTTEGLAGLEVGYSVKYFSSYWRIDPWKTITHWCVIDEPIENETGFYRDPLGRLNIVSKDRRGVDLYDIGPGAG